MVRLQRARKRSLPALIIVMLTLGLALRPAAAAVSPAATGGEWVKLATPLAPGGTVMDLAIAPSAPETLYALLDGISETPLPRLYRSQDAALSWTQVYTFTQSVANLTLDPSAPDTIYAGGESGLYRSPDGGLSWTPVYTLGQAVAVVSSALIYAGGAVWTPACAHVPLKDTLLARSTDSGGTWQTVSLGCHDDIRAFAVDPTDPQRLYVATVLDPYQGTYQIWGSPDGGLTWQGLLSEAFTLRNQVYDLAIDPLAPQHIYFSGSLWASASLDGGLTWQRLEGLPVAPVVFAFSGGSLVAAPMWNTHGVYRSEDGGQTWWQSVFQLPQGVNVLYPIPGQPEAFYAGLRAYGVWRSANRGGSWQEVNQGIRTPTWVMSLAADPSDPQRLFAGSAGPRWDLFASGDGGLSWTLTLTDTPIVDIAIHPITATVVYAASPKGLFVTTDGVAWSNELPGYKVSDIAFSGHPQPQVLAGGTREDLGQGFVAHYHPDVDPSEWGWHVAYPESAWQIYAVAGDPHHPEVFYAAGYDDNYGMGAGIWRSQDGGHTWRQVFHRDNIILLSLLVDPLQSGRVYAAGYGCFYLSQDGGTSWSPLNNGLPYHTGDIVQDELGQLFVGGGGVWSLPPGQSTWRSFGLPESLSSLIMRPGAMPALFAGGMNGIWRRDLPPLRSFWLPIIGR